MQAHVVGYHGSYRYPDRAALERAVEGVTAAIFDETSRPPLGPMRCFVTNGTILTVNLELSSASAEHQLAAEKLFLILAFGALEGSVRTDLMPVFDSA